jgi:hypothetical protein
VGKSKDEGKKPGDAAGARKRHVARQGRQDALVRLKAGETVSIMAYTHEGYKRFTVRPLGLGEPHGGEVLVLLERKIWVTDYYEKDGCKVRGTGSTYHVPPDKVFGIVVKEGQDGT